MRCGSGVADGHFTEMFDAARKKLLQKAIRPPTSPPKEKIPQNRAKYCC